jgi:hypothetical protein
MGWPHETSVREPKGRRSLTQAGDSLPRISLRQVRVALSCEEMLNIRQRSGRGTRMAIETDVRLNLATASALQVRRDQPSPEAAETDDPFPTASKRLKKAPPAPIVVSRNRHVTASRTLPCTAPVSRAGQSSIVSRIVKLACKRSLSAAAKAHIRAPKNRLSNTVSS